MNTKLALLFLFLSYFVFCNFQCGDDDYGPPINVYSKIEFSKIQKIYPLGDTLWLSTTIPPSDIYESERFPFSLTIKGEPVEFEVNQAIENSVVIDHQNNGSVIDLEFGCPSTTDDYQFEFGIIFQKKGLYSLQFFGYQAPYLISNISCDTLNQDDLMTDGVIDLPLLIFCQEEESDTVSLGQSFNFSIHPELNFQDLEAKNSSGNWIVETKNQIERPTLSYTFGLTHCIDFPKGISVKYGFYFSMKRIRSKKQELLWFESSLNPPGTIIRIYKYDQYRFPLILKLRLGKKKRNFVALGASLNFHNNVEIIERINHPEKGLGRVRASNDFETKTASESYFVSFGKEFPFIKNKLLGIEPFFSFSTENMETDFYSQSFYAFGLKINYTFYNFL